MNSILSNLFIKNSFIFTPKIHRIIIESMIRRRGLVVLYVSKAYSLGKNGSEVCDTNQLSLIKRNQKELSQITDMIHVSQVLHKQIVDYKQNQFNDRLDEKVSEDVYSGNTISILIGDLLLAQSSRGLALIRNPTITGLIGEAIGNFSEGEFFKSELIQYQNNFESLEKYCYLSGGSLLAHSCQSAILLAKYDKKAQNEAFLIGKHMGIAFRLSDLLIGQSKSKQNTDCFDEDLDMFDINSIKLLLDSNVKKAYDLIKGLETSEATKSLIDILFSIENIESINQIN